LYARALKQQDKRRLGKGQGQGQIRAEEDVKARIVCLFAFFLPHDLYILFFFTLRREISQPPSVEESEMRRGILSIVIPF
jgi:hypothetical protein